MKHVVFLFFLSFGPVEYMFEVVKRVLYRFHCSRPSSSLLLLDSSSPTLVKTRIHETLLSERLGDCSNIHIYITRSQHGCCFIFLSSV